MKAILITNIPSPYRVLQFDELQRMYPHVKIIYKKEIETCRQWLIPDINHNYTILKRGHFEVVSLISEIIKEINQTKSKVVIMTGFSADTIICFIYAKITGRKTVFFSDSWINSVNTLGIARKLIRKMLIPHSNANICVSEKGKELFLEYGANLDSIFVAPLAIDNNYYSKFIREYDSKEYDLVFSGQLIERKMPMFITNVVDILKAKGRNISILIMGEGPLKNEFIQYFIDNSIDYSYPGFIQQTFLPDFYAKAKILVFPTKEDAWGIVANEACAVGIPVVTCENAGAADDLIKDNYNGYVLPLVPEIWAEKISNLLDNKDLYETFSTNSLERVKKFSIYNAADGIKQAIKYCLNEE